ncbi:MAG: hypothetical protein AB7I04_05800 [Pseudomonadales bacterium]
MLPEFPHVSVEHVNVLEHPGGLRERGIRRVPALVHGERSLSKLFLTRRSIRRFLAGV